MHLVEMLASCMIVTMTILRCRLISLPLACSYIHVEAWVNSNTQDDPEILQVRWLLVANYANLCILGGWLVIA